MDVGGWKGLDGRIRTDLLQRTSNETKTNVKQNSNERRTKRRWTSNEMAMDIGRNNRTKLTMNQNGGTERITITTNYTDGDVIKWSMSVNFATMVCKKKNLKFSFTSYVFFFSLLLLLLLLLLECYKGYSLHDYKLKNT